MTKLNSIKEKISNEGLKVSINDLSKSLSVFFNVLVIQVNKEFINES